jgi:hypothetical protein
MRRTPILGQDLWIAAVVAAIFVLSLSATVYDFAIVG